MKTREKKLLARCEWLRISRIFYVSLSKKLNNKRYLEIYYDDLHVEINKRGKIFRK